MPGHGAHGERRQSLPRLVATTGGPARPSGRSGPGARLTLVALVSLAGCAPAPPPALHESPFLQRTRQLFARIPAVLARNHRTFPGPDGAVSAFAAGGTYPQIWLRDSAWLVEAAAAYYPRETLTSWLDLHLGAAEKGGRLRDWVAKGDAAVFREWAPRVQERDGVVFDTNTNESDQESSAVLALCRVEELLGGRTGADPGPRGHRWTKLGAAMHALLRDRVDRKSGLVWSGLTADWGDVSPVYPDQRAIYLDRRTPRTLSLYTNVMAYEALRCLSVSGGRPADRSSWAAHAARLKERIRAQFWMADRGYFRIRRALDPVPDGFEDDGLRFALGGNALAALFDVADDAEAAGIFEAAERLRAEKKFSTVSTTLIPPYPRGAFRHPAMREPFQYQNGGQWDWFGATLAQAEFDRGFSERARVHLDQIAERILSAGPGIHEWYAQDGAPKGSDAYAAAAAAIHNAVVEGLLGVSRSGAGYRIAIRTGETLLPFEVQQRSAGGRLIVSQTVGSSTIDVLVQGTASILEVCSVIPVGSRAGDPIALDTASPQEVRSIGRDTLVCADTSSMAPPVRVRFGITR